MSDTAMHPSALRTPQDSSGRRHLRVVVPGSKAGLDERARSGAACQIASAARRRAASSSRDSCAATMMETGTAST